MKPSLFIVAIFTMSQWLAVDLCAQDDEATEFKALLLKKFDTDLNGALAGLEKYGAVRFLKGVDSDGDSGISAEEQAAAIAALKRMPDPKKPLPKPAPAAKQKSIPEEAKPKITIGARPTTKSIAINRAKMGRVKVPGKTTSSGDIDTLRKVPGYYDNSTIIAVSGFHSVVSKGAVLHVPPSLAGMIIKEPKGKLMSWPQFVAKNSRYIDLYELDEKLVRGKQLLKGSEKRDISGRNKIVVAVYGNNPFSIGKREEKPVRK